MKKKSEQYKAYVDFYNARREKAFDFVRRDVARKVKSGFNDSAAVTSDSLFIAMKKIPEFSEQVVWESAWNAALAEVKRQRDALLEMCLLAESRITYHAPLDASLDKLRAVIAAVKGGQP